MSPLPSGPIEQQKSNRHALELCGRHRCGPSMKKPGALSWFTPIRLFPCSPWHVFTESQPELGVAWNRGHFPGLNRGPSTTVLLTGLSEHCAYSPGA